MSDAVSRQRWTLPSAKESGERWLCGDPPLSAEHSGDPEGTQKSGHQERSPLGSPALGAHSDVTTLLPNPSLWFASANSPLCVDLFGVQLVDSSLQVQCKQCATRAFCEGSRVAFRVDGVTPVGCGACCRCMAVLVRRAQWSLLADQLAPEIPSAMYRVITTNHRTCGLKQTSNSCLEGNSAATGCQSHSGSPVGEERRTAPISQLEEPFFGLEAARAQRRESGGDVPSQAPSLSSQQYSDGEGTKGRDRRLRNKQRDKEMRIAAEQRSVLPFFFYVLPILCSGERVVVRDVWRYVQFSAACTRPLRLWKECERCRARPSSKFAFSRKTAEALKGLSGGGVLPEGAEAWWGLAHMGPGGLCGCPESLDAEAAEVERREKESAVAYRERMYLLALQRWAMGNDLRATGDALVKVTESSPEDLCALLLATRLLFVSGESHRLLQICTRPDVVDAQGHVPFFWSLVAFAADQSALPHVSGETLSYRAARFAVTLYPDTVHAHHTLLHNFRGGDFFTDSLLLARKFHRAWARCNAWVRHHLWWHIAVVLVEAHQFRNAMRLFWRQVYHPKKHTGWDNHYDAMQLLLRLKIIHGWSVEFWRHHAVDAPKAADCCTTGQNAEESKQKRQQVEAGEETVLAAREFEQELTLAFHHVLSRVRREEHIRATSQECGCADSRGNESYTSSSRVDSATPRTPVAFLRGPSASGLPVACYIATLALTRRAPGVPCNPPSGLTKPLYDRLSESNVNQGEAGPETERWQSTLCNAETNGAEEELRKLEEEVVPFLGWKGRNYLGQLSISVGKAFNAWANGDFATSAKLLEPLVRQDLAAQAAREEVQHSRISVTEAERGNTRMQTQRELVNEAVRTARDAELQAEIQGGGTVYGSSSSRISCLELLYASREQADLVSLVFLDAVYHLRKCGPQRVRVPTGEHVSTVDERGNVDEMEATLSKLLNTKLCMEACVAAPSLHMYLCLLYRFCPLKSDSGMLTPGPETHRQMACDLIEKYGEEGILIDELVCLT